MDEEIKNIRAAVSDGQSRYVTNTEHVAITRQAKWVAAQASDCKLTLLKFSSAGDTVTKAA